MASADHKLSKLAQQNSGAKSVAHPYRRFSGTLCVLDKASKRSPAGAHYHRIILSSQAAAKMLPSLMFCPVEWTRHLGEHGAEGARGIITDAYIEDSKILVSGIIFEKYLREKFNIAACAEPLGMSFEMRDAEIEDIRESCWKITGGRFDGIAILLQSRAAYGTDSTFQFDTEEPHV